MAAKNIDKHIDKKKLRRDIFLFIPLLLFFILYSIFYPIVYIIKEKGKEKKGNKIAFIILYAAEILSAIFLPVLFWIIMGLIGAFATWVAVEYVKDDCTVSTSLGGRTQRARTNPIGNIFSGLSVMEAKKLYRKLIRKYHPDNPGGNAEYTKKITTDYMAYTNK
jgi:hypothetical protein